jgi:hypothetical protein
MKYVNKNLTLPELFNVISKMEGTLDDKAKFLKQFGRRDVLWFVDFMYNTNKEGLTVPEFTPSRKPVGLNYMTIGTALTQIQSALQHRNNPKIYERNLKLVLESISADEAELLVQVFKGGKVEGVSKAVFKRAFPGYFPDVERNTVELV